jgi:hypothetical protein
MMRLLYLAAPIVLLAIGSAGCSMMDRESNASPARVAGSGNSVYAPGAGGIWDGLPDPYHYRCTGECLGL